MGIAVRRTLAGCTNAMPDGKFAERKTTKRMAMKDTPLCSRIPNLSALIEKERLSRLRYNRIRKKRGAHVTSVYDVSTSCNMKCPGCFYFATERNQQGSRVAETGDFGELFASERARGVTYPILGGAEPALNQDVLIAASNIWHTGMIHTNGTIRINEKIPFRLYVSLWGGATLTRILRGVDAYNQVLHNIAGDPRVLVNYTITRPGIEDVLPVVADCAEAGIRISFQVFCPTHRTSNSQYLVAKNQHISPIGHETCLALSSDDDKRALTVIEQALCRYPETVVYSKTFSQWLFRTQHHFTCDATGVAENCPVRCDCRHRHYMASLTQERIVGCGHNTIKCHTCRAYTATYPLFLTRKTQRERTVDEWREWLEVRDLYGRIYYPDWDS